MTAKEGARRPVALVPPIAFEFEGWPALLVAMGEDTAVLNIEDEDLELAAAKLPANIRQMARDQLSG